MVNSLYMSFDTQLMTAYYSKKSFNRETKSLLGSKNSYIYPTCT